MMNTAQLTRMFWAINATFLGVNLYIFLITYLIPLAIICPLYAKAARKLWFNQAPGNHLIEEQQSRQLVTRRKVVRMLVIIVVVFAICWLPAQALHLFWAAAPYSDHLPAIVMYLGFWVAHANSAINPWLYIALSTKIRLAFNRMVTFRNLIRPSGTVPREGVTQLRPRHSGSLGCSHTNQETKGTIHSTKISGNFGLKLNGSVWSNRKSFEKQVHLLRWSSFPGWTGLNFG